MAEKLLSAALTQEGEPYASIEVTSAGVVAYEGSPASIHSVEAMKEKGLDISNHRSRLLTREMVEKAGLILAMTEMHEVAIEEEYGDLAKGKLFLWRQWMGISRQVGDPFGSDLAVYRACRNAISEALPSVVEFIKKRLSAG
jgi:protein-tyrosine phosphatase